MSEQGQAGSLGWTLGLGIVFVTLGAFRVLLIKFSANEDHTYDYLPVTVNVSAEFVKLVVCFILAVFVHFKEGRGVRSLFSGELRSYLSLLKWAVPGFLYFCDNLLSFYIIKHIQPAVAVLLGNFSIVITAVLFRIILKRELSHIQWASLGVLFLAVMSLSSQSGNRPPSHDDSQHHQVDHVLTSDTQMNSNVQKHSRHVRSAKPFTFNKLKIKEICSSVKTVSTVKGLNETISLDPHDMIDKGTFSFNTGYLFVLLQCVFSSLANIYNEKIFKEEAKGCIFIKNCKLYMFGVLFSCLLILIPDTYREKVMTCGLFNGHNIYSVLLIFVTAFYGLNVALILIFRDNMFHVFSLQLITVVVITASIYFFKFRPRLNFFFIAPMVLLSIYIYNAAKVKAVGIDNGSVKVHRVVRRHRSGASFSEDDTEPLVTEVPVNVHGD